MPLPGRVDLVELSILLNVPQFERIIYHKVEELKLFLKDELTLYRDLAAGFRKTAYGDMTVCTTTPASKNQTYMFHLNQNDEGIWTITELGPIPQGSYHPQDILPQEVIDHIVKHPISPSRTHTIKKFSPPALKDRRFDLQFVMYSQFHALGTICEIFHEDSKQTDSGMDNVVNIDDYYNPDLPEFHIKELNQYLSDNSQFKKQILSDFYLKWKPLIDRKLI